MSQTATNNSTSSGQGRDQAKKLKKTRQEAKLSLKEANRLVKRYAKRLDQEKRAQVQDAMAAVEEKIKATDPESLSGAVKKLENMLQKHFGGLRRGPGLEFTFSISKALAVALLLRLFLVEPFKIPSGSMIPSLLIGDHIFVSKLSYGIRLPIVNWELVHWGGYRRGEVIVFANPQDDHRPFLERRDYIKRIIGLPGDLIEVKDEVVYVNSVPQPRQLAQEHFHYFDRLGDDGPWLGKDDELWKETLMAPDGKTSITHQVLRDPERPHYRYEGPFRVPEGHLFMMGDNRDNSQDGRAGGWFVPTGHVKGRAQVVWLSWGKPGSGLWGDNTGIRWNRLFTKVK